MVQLGLNLSLHCLVAACIIDFSNDHDLATKSSQYENTTA